MRLSDIGELSLLKRIRERFKVRLKDVIAGIGDDSAAVIPHNQTLLLTTDLMAEGVHFDLGFTTYFQLGYKIISVNVSDIYAMGGSPRFVLLDIAADKDTDERCIESFFNGLQKAMDNYRVKLIGGDLSASKSGMVVSATLMGYARKPVMRSGARPGDRIYVTGNLGDSACGLELLKRIRKPVPIERAIHRTKYTPSLILPPRRGGQGWGGESKPRALDSKLSKLGLTWRVVEPLLRRHLLPEARNPGKTAKIATAMIDVSDGLFIDLSRLCDESRVGARIYMKHLPLSYQMKKAASALGIEPYGLATSGGEDYELLFTAPPDRKVDAIYIGEITDSERIFIDRKGKERPFSTEGYEHWH